VKRAPKACEFTALYEKRGKWIIATVAEIPGVNTQGRTMREARANLQDALRLVLECNRRLVEETFRPEELLKRVRSRGGWVVKRTALIRHLEEHGCFTGFSLGRRTAFICRMPLAVVREACKRVGILLDVAEAQPAAGAPSAVAVSHLCRPRIVCRCRSAAAR